MNEELKPCPFCGGEARIENTSYMGELLFRVGCSEANCRGRINGTHYESKQETIAAWNTRAERTCHWVYFEDSVSTPEFHEDDWHLECSGCGFDPESIIGPNVDGPELLSCFVHCPSCGAKVVCDGRER